MTPAVLTGDLGGTKCRLALVDADLGVHGAEQFETVADQGEFLAIFDATIARVLERKPTGLAVPAAAGIGIAGVVPGGGDIVRHTPNLPLDDYPLPGHVRERFGLPTTMLNDGRASAWGEFLRGHAAASDPLLCLFFGTGIGIGLMVGGAPYEGGYNAAGEIGHTTFRPGGRRCACGGVGHFEVYCGGRAITERAEEAFGPAEGAPWDVGDVVAFARLDDDRGETARGILEDAALAAGVLVENLCTLLNPSAVVLGGGVLAGWPELRTRIEQHVRAHTRDVIHDSVRFVPSVGGSDAILWGAAAATGSLSLA